MIDGVRDYVVTRTADNWPDSRYKITGGPPLGRMFPGGEEFRWTAWSWTVRGAKRKIRRRRAFLARTDRVVYRESA